MIYVIWKLAIANKTISHLLNNNNNNKLLTTKGDLFMEAKTFYHDLIKSKIKKWLFYCMDIYSKAELQFSDTKKLNQPTLKL